MRDPEFEKHIQQKLGELGFPPSDIVWQNVDKEINKEKKRRVPLFWLFFLGGTTLVFLSGYWLLMPRNKNGAPNNKIKSEKIDVVKKKSGPVNITPQVKGGSTLLNNKKFTDNGISKANEKKKMIQVHQINMKNKVSINQQQTLQDAKGTLSKTKSVPFQLASISLGNSKNSLSGTLSKKTNEQGGDLPQEKNQRKKENQVDVNRPQVNKELSTATPEIRLVSKAKLDSAAKFAAGSNKTNQLKKQRSFTYGLETGAGISGLIFTNQNRPFPIPSGLTSYYSTTASHPDLAFHLGFFLQKQLSRKIAISAGIDYHYYSIRINTGTKIDSVVYPGYFSINSSFLYPSATPRNALYSSGTSERYTNRFNFISLPLMVDYQINSSPKIPVRLQAGVYLSYLVGTNALQFDPASGTYYKDNGLFKRLQPVLSTGLAFGFHNRNMLFQLGPEIQYGTSEILKSNANMHEQSLYGGIKLSLTSQKK
jgi:hypothetical protein